VCSSDLMTDRFAPRDDDRVGFLLVAEDGGVFCLLHGRFARHFAASIYRRHYTPLWLTNPDGAPIFHQFQVESG
ncbi:hypothetical protein NZA98_39660, partial [Escherichia coli]|nr:hypothetical protein [Escherichia coli]